MAAPSLKNLVVTARAPVNIAVIKYWGKFDEKLKIPINDSLSGTLNIDDMCTTTSVYLSEDFQNDELILNGQAQDLTSINSPARQMIEDIRTLCSSNNDKINLKARIVSANNFPTAAGLASSAAGYACLAYALGHAYGLTDASTLSKVARKGSGSACRSLFGGFVQWTKGFDHDTSLASQVVDHLHWPKMRVVICIVDDVQKDVSSSAGMAQSVKTSPLIKFRAEQVVPNRLAAIKEAILERDFETFAEITMQDSNEFHAICLDTYPPLFYMNDTSRQIIKVCSLINSFYNCNKVAYTFDAGPNGCIYVLDDFVDIFIQIVQMFFPPRGDDQQLKIQGISHSKPDAAAVRTLEDYLLLKKIKVTRGGLSYLINTSIGRGPEIVEERIN